MVQMDSQAEKIVGVIGGMGPEATVDLMQQVINATPAQDDADHIRMLVDNNPKVPSRIKALIEGDGESPAACLTRMAKGLEAQGASFLVIPCNTAHHYFLDVEAAVNIPVLNLIELTSNHARNSLPNLRKVGLLASTALQLIHLYEPWFEKHDIQVLYPSVENQQAVMDLICAVKAKRQTSLQIQYYNQAVNDLRDQGAECLVVACTELSVISGPLQTELPIYDASKILAETIVYKAQGNRK